MAVRIRFCAVAAIFLCTVLAERGASVPQKCESDKFTQCFDNILSRLKLEVDGGTNTRESLRENCATVDGVFACTKELVIDGCEKEEKSQLQLLEDGFRATKNSLCDDNLYENMVQWNRCVNRTVSESCQAAYREERQDLAHKGHLSPEEERCRYGEYSCLLKAAEDCPSSSPAREAMKNYFNTFLDLHKCPRFDGSSGRQRCDAQRFTGCFSKAMDEIKFPSGKDEITAELLAEDCAIAKSVDSCTKYMVIEGCSNEYKQQLEYLRSDFDSARSYICDGNLYESMVEWHRCLDRGTLKSCVKEQPFEDCSRYNCMSNATAKCPPQSIAMKAIHHWVNTHRDLKNCTRVDLNSGITTSPKILLALAALCISLYPLRK